MISWCGKKCCLRPGGCRGHIGWFDARENDKLDEREDAEERQGEKSNRAENECLTPPTPIETPAAPDETPIDNEAAIEEPIAEGHRHCICKESAYIRQIREGFGCASNLPNSHVVPLGIQVVEEVTGNKNESGGLAEE